MKILWRLDRRASITLHRLWQDEAREKSETQYRVATGWHGGFGTAVQRAVEPAHDLKAAI